MRITEKQARQFILAYQGLLPPRRLRGKEGIMAFVRRVGCLQYDPLDMAGTNPNLVLQSRVRDYRPQLLEELLYADRQLVDGWDKNAAIYPVEDWPCFWRYRIRKVTRHGREVTELNEAVPKVLAELEERGPLSSQDFGAEEKVDWFWGPASIARVALEALYAWGDIVIHSRVGQRRLYDLASRHIPAEILNAPDPNRTDEEYFQWQVKRRIGAIGMLWNRGSDAWLGIRKFKAPQRNAAFSALEEEGGIVPIEVEALACPVFIVREQLPLLEQVLAGSNTQAQAAFIAPLDNLLWDRKLISALFGFEYTWEVYKPAEQREYGYYVLPVLYGDRFVARFEPRYHKKTGVLEILNWWWEPDTEVSNAMESALKHAARDFMNYLGADKVISRAESPFASLGSQVE